MRLANPEWLYLFFLIPGLAFFYAWADRRKQTALQRFGNLDTPAKALVILSGSFRL